MLGYPRFGIQGGGRGAAIPARPESWLAEETGDATRRGTRPRTRAHGLTDSSAGPAAWIAERFRRGRTATATSQSVFTKDRMPEGIAPYRFTGAIGSSFWPYDARVRAEKTFTDLRRWPRRCARSIAR